MLLTSLPSSDALHAVAEELHGKGRVVMETTPLPIEDKERARDTLAKKGIVLLDCRSPAPARRRAPKDWWSSRAATRRDSARRSRSCGLLARGTTTSAKFGNGSKDEVRRQPAGGDPQRFRRRGFALGLKAGLDPKTIYDVIANSAGASRMFQVRGPQMVANDYDDATISVQLFQKDMRIIGDFAARHGVATPLFNTSAMIYNAAMAQGHAEEDTAAVCAVLEALSGIKR